MSQAFWYWLKLGFIGFGGPAGQISLMHQELVERRRWISEQRFLHALNYCMMLPGPEAQQLATYLGWLMHGTLGGIIAGVLFVLPSLFIMAALSWIYLAFGNLPTVAGVLYGIKPAVTAVVLFAAWRIGSRVLKDVLLWAVAISAFTAIFFFQVPFPWIVLSAATLGYLAGWIAPERFAAGNGNSSYSAGPALIDDHHSTPSQARFSGPRLLRLILVGLAVWAGAMAALIGLFGWQGTLTQMAWFFTKAALLTFGGAYAVLPYVYQGAVERYEWLSAGQMIDGLALGETTPGPLIMIVAFVGFLGGWERALFGPEALALAGLAGAAVATFFTFLPSFLFILIGGPLVEASRGNLRFTAPLTAVTAAVVGVIVNLAVFFAYHVFWPAGLDGYFEWAAAAIAALAFMALFYYRIAIIPVIAACGGVGWLYFLMSRM